MLKSDINCFRKFLISFWCCIFFLIGRDRTSPSPRDRRLKVAPTELELASVRHAPPFIIYIYFYKNTVKKRRKTRLHVLTLNKATCKRFLPFRAWTLSHESDSFIFKSCRESDRVTHQRQSRR